jgi:hypothetical protein
MAPAPAAAGLERREQVLGEQLELVASVLGEVMVGCGDGALMVLRLRAQLIQVPQ